MRKPIKRVLKGMDRSAATALAVLSAAFFGGGLLGCVLAAGMDSGGDSLADYLRQFLSLAGEQAPPLAGVVWDSVRWPLLVFSLGFTTLGLLGIPLAFAVRGFLLSFSIASFVRSFGERGEILAALLFGVSGILATPVLFVLGVQGLTASRCLASRVLGDGRWIRPYDRGYFFRCGLCAAVLCVCIFLEYALIPALVRQAAQTIQLST